MGQPEFLKTLIGEDSLVRGDLEANGRVRIDGDLLGSVKTDSQVIISHTGRVKGNVQAREVIVGGVIKGDVIATQRVTLLATGLLLGKVISPSLSVEQGALLEGLCHVTPRVQEVGAEYFYTRNDSYSIVDKFHPPSGDRAAESVWTPSS